MGFLTSESIRANFSKLIIDGNEANIKHCAYEMQLGDEYVISGSYLKTKRVLSIGGQFVIPPGRFALVTTKETINIPGDLLGFLSIKATYKLSGLINVSGFHVDPGFKGKLKFSLYNAGNKDVVLTRDQKLFSIWFARLEKKTRDLYVGSHQGQVAINSHDVQRMLGIKDEFSSIKDDINKLRNNMSRLDVAVADQAKQGRAVIGLVISIVAIVVSVAGIIIS